MHESRIFLVFDAANIVSLAHTEYVALLRGELTFARYANQTVRLADWYVELREGRPVALYNETYSVLQFDERGSVQRDLERRGLPFNHRFYDALARSSYPDSDDDPLVQRLRKELQTEYAWRPNADERAALHALVFGQPAGE